MVKTELLGHPVNRYLVHLSQIEFCQKTLYTEFLRVHCGSLQVKPNFKFPVSLAPLAIESQSFSRILLLLSQTSGQSPDCFACLWIKRSIWSTCIEQFTWAVSVAPPRLELMDPALAALNQWGTASSWSCAGLHCLGTAAIPDHSFPAPFDCLPLLVTG